MPLLEPEWLQVTLAANNVSHVSNSGMLQQSEMAENVSYQPPVHVQVTIYKREMSMISEFNQSSPLLY